MKETAPTIPISTPMDTNIGWHASDEVVIDSWTTVQYKDSFISKPRTFNSAIRSISDPTTFWGVLSCWIRFGKFSIFSGQWRNCYIVTIMQTQTPWIVNITTEEPIHSTSFYNRKMIYGYCVGLKFSPSESVFLLPEQS